MNLTIKFLTCAVIFLGMFSQLSAGHTDSGQPKNILYEGQELRQGESLFITSENSLWNSAELVMQEDGHLVLYMTYVKGERVPIWATGVYGRFAKVDDGLLTVYALTAYGLCKAWSSDNFYKAGAYVRLEENEGMPRVAIYSSKNEVVWGTDINGIGWWYDNTPW